MFLFLRRLKGWITPGIHFLSNIYNEITKLIHNILYARYSIPKFLQAVMFHHRQESTYALYQYLWSLGYSLSHFLSTTVCLVVKGLLAVSSILYIAVQIDYSHQRHSQFISNTTSKTLRQEPYKRVDKRKKGWRGASAPSTNMKK